MPSTSAASSTPTTLTYRAVSTTIPLLRLIQNTSAVSFSIFTLLHLSSPLSALLPSRPKYLSSPENRASGLQLVARELYQGEWSEPILVWGSLGAHVVSGVAVRWLSVLGRLERRKMRREEVKSRARAAATIQADELPTMGGTVAGELEKDLAIDEVVDELEAELVATTTADEELVVPAVASPSSSSIFPTPNFHQKTGYLLIPFVLHHAYLHRLLPASPFPPISSLSPAFFSYAFTSLSLNHSSPLIVALSALSYTGVTLLATYHGLLGWRILLDPTAPHSLSPRRKRAGEKDGLRRKITRGREWQAAWLALVTGVAVGTARIAGHLGGEKNVKVPDFVARRMEFVLRKGFGMA
jgi:hypothetical protein